MARPGRYGDGAGLWLQVRDAEKKSWLFRYTLGGRARQMGLGPVNDVSLAEARDAASTARRHLRQGVDPIEHKRTETRTTSTMTFAQVATLYIATHEASWRNAKHRDQWRRTLSLAGEAFGSGPVASIATGDVVRFLEPIWSEKPETASRHRGRIEATLDYATVRGWRTGENPARWRGHLSKLLPSPAKLARVQHHSALAWPAISQFMTDLRAEQGVSAAALEFVILTAARTGEVIGARWSEIDEERAVWCVPGDRMKAGRDHRVPLSSAAVAVLQRLLPLRDDAAGAWIFPGTTPGKPLSNMAMAMLLRRMKRETLTVHGFRSTFRDWAAEATNYPHEVAEMALAHTISSAVERAYRRGDLVEKRRDLMNAWAVFCEESKPEQDRRSDKAW